MDDEERAGAPGLKLTVRQKLCRTMMLGRTQRASSWIFLLPDISISDIGVLSGNDGLLFEVASKALPDQ